MSIEIIIPDIGEGKFPIIEALVAVGDAVAEEEGIFVMESDKATMEVPAPASGVITSLTVGVGDEVGTGDIIGMMTAEGGEASASAKTETTEKEEQPAEEATEKNIEKPAEKPAESVKAEKVVPAQTASVVDEKAFREAHASPSIRKLARELGVDLGRVQGSGRKARITEEDVKQFVKAAMSGQATTTGTVGSGIPAVPAQDFSKFGSVEAHKLSKINTLTGEHMTRCWLNIPHVTQHDEADITDLEIFWFRV